jgi:hypothetical protein
MKMIAHQTERMDLPIGLLAGLLEGQQKQLPILIIEIDRLPPITPVHDMIDGSRKFNAQWSWRMGSTFEPSVNVPNRRCSIVRTDQSGDWLWARPAVWAKGKVLTSKKGRQKMAVNGENES